MSQKKSNTKKMDWPARKYLEKKAGFSERKQERQYESK